MVKWTEGKCVTIHLDCDKWNIEFIVDGNKYKKLDLRKDLTYYPAMVLCCCDGKSQYSILEA